MLRDVKPSKYSTDEDYMINAQDNFKLERQNCVPDVSLRSESKFSMCQSNENKCLSLFSTHNLKVSANGILK